MTSKDVAAKSFRQKVIAVVFVALVLDLIAFTLPLPLFPRLVEHFLLKEQKIGSGLLLPVLQKLRAARSALLAFSGSPADVSSLVESHALVASRYDVVLLGGVLGSVFSAAQWLISPRIGAASDKFGRKSVLLATMIGNFVSNAIWMVSTNFNMFLASRVVGGLSEGNVQLSTAILADVSTPETRGSAFALVGIAFSLCFTLGPPLGAYLASRPSSHQLAGYDLNIYATPAAIALALLALEVLLLWFMLPETRSGSSAPQRQEEKSAVRHRQTPTKSQRLRSLENVHLAFLFVFSGCEFTLTFLTFDLLGFSNRENGKLLGVVGLLSCLLQGGYVRRKSHVKGPVFFLRIGLTSCALGLLLLATLGKFGTTATPAITSWLLWSSSLCLATTTATVSTSLSTMASLECSESEKGRLLGQYRSAGQLGRALGPIVIASLYFSMGPFVCYGVSCAVMMSIQYFFRGLLIPSKPNAKRE